MPRSSALAGLFLLASPLFADTPCSCDVTHPESLDVRQCSLCKEAEKQPVSVPIFFLKDANPKKLNRLLVLPRAHAPGIHRIADLPKDDQIALWTAAVTKAKELYPDGSWAIAFNGDHVRTQCHTHLHIGKLLPGVETGNFLIVDNASAIQAPDENGYWIHQADRSGKLHIHLGEQITETVLLR